MPNIGIHGFERETAKKWERTIKAECMYEPFLSEMIFEIFATPCTHSDGTDAPYIRITSTPEREKKDPMETIDKLRAIVSRFGIDVEVVLLHSFDEGSKSYSRNSDPVKIV